MKKSKKVMMITTAALLLIVFVVVLSISLTRAFMDINTDPASTNIAIKNCANIKITDTNNNSISLNNTYPMSRNAALNNITPYTFTVSGSCKNPVGFNIYLGLLSTNTLSANKVRYILTVHGNKSSLEEGILGTLSNVASTFTNEEKTQYNNGASGTIGNIYTIHSESLPLNTTKQYDLYLFVDSAVSDSMNQTFNAALSVKSFDRNVTPVKFETKILADNQTVSERSDFSVVNNANTTGTIYTTNRTDDDSTVYYYSGNTTNNWVVFGDNGSGTYYYWRIIRTNSTEEGKGVRLLYSGSGSSATTIPSNLTNAHIANGKYNENYDKSEYVGYMYTVGEQHGHANSSTIKTAIEEWYANNGLVNYESYINQDAVYCNDRSVATGTSWSSSSTSFNYATATRLWSNKYPTHKCGGDTTGDYYESAENRLADRFSKTNTVGNGYLAKPIGLMTADEISFAGGLYASNSPSVWYYLNENGSPISTLAGWWLGSARNWNASYGFPDEFIIFNSSYPGMISSAGVADTNRSGVRPVVSLKANVLVSGIGTIASPYIIEGLEDL